MNTLREELTKILAEQVMTIEINKTPGKSETTIQGDTMDKLLSLITQYAESEKGKQREEISDYIFSRKFSYKDKILTDMFINGRFWEAQEIWEYLTQTGEKESNSTP